MWIAGVKLFQVSGTAMASIIQFIPRGVFDDAATKVMGEAFDAACNQYQGTDQLALVQEIIARRIIIEARTGERDVTRLRDVALATLANTRPAPQ